MSNRTLLAALAVFALVTGTCSLLSGADKPPPRPDRPVQYVPPGTVKELTISPTPVDIRNGLILYPSGDPGTDPDDVPRIKSRKKLEQMKWLDRLIRQLEADPVANPPAMILECINDGKKLYYLPPRCCDIFGVLYDSKGDVICHPDGGITGRGDGRCPDLDMSKSRCTVLWQDSRQ